MELSEYLESKRKIIEEGLRKFLPQKRPLILHNAMRYSTFSEGKRLRPILVIAGAEICGGRDLDVIEAACAIELIHTYSLIHDDLPAIDNDDYRRGKLTCHKKFSEDIAILTGDALLTYAFELIGKNIIKVGTSEGGKIIQEVAKAIGKDGMVAGQVADIIYSGSRREVALKNINYIHLNKTAKLIEVSSKLGAMLLGATQKKVDALGLYGRHIGLAFQVVDDLLDFKDRDSDIKNKRLTYPAIYGVARSKEVAAEHIKKAKEALKLFKDRAVLGAIADFVIERKH